MRYHYCGLVIVAHVWCRCRGCISQEVRQRLRIGQLATSYIGQLSVAVDGNVVDFRVLCLRPECLNRRMRYLV